MLLVKLIKSGQEQYKKNKIKVINDFYIRLQDGPDKYIFISQLYFSNNFKVMRHNNHQLNQSSMARLNHSKTLSFEDLFYFVINETKNEYLKEILIFNIANFKDKKVENDKI